MQMDATFTRRKTQHLQLHFQLQFVIANDKPNKFLFGQLKYIIYN